MTRFWKGSVFVLTGLVCLSLGGNAYSIFFYPQAVQARARQNEVEAAHNAQRERDLAQREELLRTETQRLDAQRASTDALTALARQLGILAEDFKNDRQLQEWRRGVNDFNRKLKEQKDAGRTDR